ATHVVANANPVQNVASNAVVNTLHYTRQGFFFISALVLVHSVRHRAGLGAPSRGALGRASQMRRRVSVLGVPYLVWSTFYAVLGLITAYSLWAAKRLPWTWFVGLVQGTDGYHMYFLLVSVEFAVVFPLFMWLLNATRGHHAALLVVSGSLELATMAVFHYWYQPDGWWRALAGESSLTAYQFWVLLGGVAALHLDRMHRFLVAHRLLVGGAFGAVLLAVTAWYFAGVAAGAEPEFAGRSLQPVTVPLALAAIGAIYLVSVWIAGWVERGNGQGRDRPRRMLVVGTYLSFGIFLSHPAILTGLLILQRRLPGGQAWHPVLATTLIGLLDLVLSVAVALALSRTPWSKALIGRPPLGRTAAR
ncbi:MAG: acyltransferase, partial [Micromonosporaceae bacterium]|nr:acyltransferase [Micromonosporaceae bacterium]